MNISYPVRYMIQRNGSTSKDEAIADTASSEIAMIKGINNIIEIFIQNAGNKYFENKSKSVERSNVGKLKIMKSKNVSYR